MLRASSFEHADGRHNAHLITGNRGKKCLPFCKMPTSNSFLFFFFFFDIFSFDRFNFISFRKKKKKTRIWFTSCKRDVSMLYTFILKTGFSIIGWVALMSIFVKKYLPCIFIILPFDFSCAITFKHWSKSPNWFRFPCNKPDGSFAFESNTGKGYRLISIRGIGIKFF